MCRGPCVVHCPKAKGAGGGAAVAAVLVLACARPLLHALVLAAEVVVAVAVLCAAVLVALGVCRVMAWARRREVAKLATSRQPRAALPAPRLELEQAQPEVYVITDARERISR